MAVTRIRYLIAVTVVAVAATLFAVTPSAAGDTVRHTIVSLTDEELALCDANGGCVFVSMTVFLETVHAAAEVEAQRRLEDKSLFCSKGKRV